VTGYLISPHALFICLTVLLFMVPTVRECKSTTVQELANMQKKLHTTVQNFFCLLPSKIICISTFEFVPPPLFLVWLQAIENRHWYFAWIIIQGKRSILSWKVREKLGKMNSAEY